MNFALRAAAGGALGFFFYGGLWLTVRQLPRTRHPVALTMGSFLVRTLAVIAAFAFLINQHWENALACMAGFIAAKPFVQRTANGRERQAAGPEASKCT
jgi:F1F0 ATPase subunit 2